MANNFITPAIVAREALYILEKTRVFSGIVNKNYSNEFGAAKVGDVVNVRIPATLHGRTFVDQVNRQTMTEDSLPVKLDRIADVSVEISSKQLTLDIENFSAQVIEPAVRGLNNKIDTDISAFIYAAATKQITANNDGKLTCIAKTGNYFDNEDAPLDNRFIVFSPDHKYRYASVENLSKVSYAGTSDTLRDALLGRLYGIDTLMSNNLPYSKAATPGTATAYEVEKVGTGRNVKLTSVTPATGTVKKGDGFIIDNVLYRFDADATADTGTIATVALQKSSDDFLGEVAKAATIIPKSLSLGFHRDAITFATRPLELPIGGTNSYVASGENFSIRVVMDYESGTKKNLLSLDVLYGINGLHDSLAVKLIDA